MAAVTQPTGEELRREASLGRVRSIERRKRAQEQSDAVSGLSQAPSVASGMEQFQELRKGDIGEDAPSVIRMGGEGEEEPVDEAGQPMGGEGETEENETQQEQAGGPEQDRQLSGGGKESAAASQQIKKTEAVIKNLQQSERPIKIQRNKDRAALYTLHALLAFSKLMDILRWVGKWLRTVIGAWGTIILGIILTIFSVIIIPAIVILAAIGVLPYSTQTRELQTRINTANKRIAEQNKQIADIDNRIKSNYRNIFIIRQRQVEAQSQPQQE